MIEICYQEYEIRYVVGHGVTIWKDLVRREVYVVTLYMVEAQIHLRRRKDGGHDQIPSQASWGEARADPLKVDRLTINSTIYDLINIT